MEEAKERTSSKEFTDWIAYSNVEPFGYPMSNFRMGVPAAAVVNAIRASVPLQKGQRRPKAMAASDFYPQRARREPELTPEQKEHIRKKHAKRRSKK